MYNPSLVIHGVGVAGGVAPCWFTIYQCHCVPALCVCLTGLNEKGKREEIWRGLRDHWEPKILQPDFNDVKNRLAMIQAVEAVKALEENVLTDIREGDVGAVLGWGCMPWAGGPFSWLHLIGVSEAENICASLVKKYGDRFLAPELLRDLSEKKETFYSRFPKGQTNL